MTRPCRRRKIALAAIGEKTEVSSEVSSAAATVRRVSHNGPSAGSLFLRLGFIGMKLNRSKFHQEKVATRFFT